MNREWNKQQTAGITECLNKIMTMSICLSDAWLTELSSFWDAELSWSVYMYMLNSRPCRLMLLLLLLSTKRVRLTTHSVCEIEKKSAELYNKQYDENSDMNWTDVRTQQLKYMYNKKKVFRRRKKHVTIFLEMISQGVSILITQFYIFVPTLFFKETLLYSSTLWLRLALSSVFILLYLNIVRVLVVYSTNHTASQPASQSTSKQASNPSIHPALLFAFFLLLIRHTLKCNPQHVLIMYLKLIARVGDTKMINHSHIPESIRMRINTNFLLHHLLPQHRQWLWIVFDWMRGWMNLLTTSFTFIIIILIIFNSKHIILIECI